MESPAPLGWNGLHVEVQQLHSPEVASLRGSFLFTRQISRSLHGAQIGFQLTILFRPTILY